MIVLIDGKEVKVLNDIKIIVDLENEQEEELHLTVTHEGVITDVIDKEDVVLTSSETYQELVENLEWNTFTE